ncbi:tRNA (cytidine(56)-2'-O)-methyltransferase [Candidatus Micrarchaeota archaeon]|nr:tRNA (cytidine(56)-2'-O)-methyltransferase [Candidatus Micrarchaeota archaeon]MBU1682112.1 tRNA (cytidine(56)-2'-O)-methyltransferase [Candidatus Micrarchaeota archaeon]
MEIHILRLGHRLPRDERISTHVALVARAFGAGKITYCGQHDSGLEDSISRICARWGGDFAIEYSSSYKKVISQYKKHGYSLVHLTMYGLPVQDVLSKLKLEEKILLIVGSEAVPGDVYESSNYNVSITNQPHSEVAALAITLDRICSGAELEGIDFGGKIRIKPSAKGKEFV